MKKPGRFAAPAGTQARRPPASPAAPPLGPVSRSPVRLRPGRGGALLQAGSGRLGRADPLSSPTGKTRFSWSRRREGGNLLVALLVPSGGPSPFNPHSRLSYAGHPSLAGPPTCCAPRPHLGSACGSPALPPRSLHGGGERERPQGEEGGPEPSTASDAKDSSLGHGRSAAMAQLSPSPPPIPSRKAWSCSAQTVSGRDKNLGRRFW